MKRQETTMGSARKLPSPDSAQYNLFGGVPAGTAAAPLQTAVHSGRRPAQAAHSWPVTALSLRRLARTKLLKEDAVKARVTAARQAAGLTPQDRVTRQELEPSVQCQDILEERQAAR